MRDQQGARTGVKERVRETGERLSALGFASPAAVLRAERITQSPLSTSPALSESGGASRSPVVAWYTPTRKRQGGGRLALLPSPSIA
jgi:hypothetical protein